MVRKIEIKQNEQNKNRDIVRKRNEEKREFRQNERIQNRENVVEADIKLGRFLN